MKIKIGIVMILLTASLYSIEFNTYELVKVKDFKAFVQNDSKSKLDLILNFNTPHAEGPGIFFYHGNLAFYNHAKINDKNTLITNNTLSIVRSFVDSFNQDDIIYFGKYIIGSSPHDNIIIFDTNSGLEVVSNINIYSDSFEAIRRYKSLFYHDSVLFIHDNKYNLWSIKNPGLDNKKNRQNLVGEEETLALINSGEIEGVTVDSKKRLFLDGELQTISYKMYYDYYKELQNDDSKKLSYLEFQVTGNEQTAQFMTLLGKNINKQDYWVLDNKYMTIFDSTNGFLVEFFEYDRSKSDTLPAVSPEGDVYFLDYGKDKVTLYKVERQW